MRRAMVGLGVAALAGWTASRLVPLLRARSEVDPQYLHPIPLPPSVPVNAVTVGLVGRLPQGEPKPQPGVSVTRQHADGVQGVQVPVDVYVPEGHVPGSAALLWIHGGGLVMGSSAGYAEYCAQVARDLGIVVVSVEYRLAPAHPAPAAVDDCYAALRWLHSQAEELGIDASRIAVGGDSAGGGLAAATVQLAHDQGAVRPAFQLLVYPMLDDRTCTREPTVRFVWSTTANYHGWRAYLGQEPGLPEAPAYAVPARRTDLAGLPPTWIGVGALDLFHDEDVDYAERLEAADVPVELVVVPGAFHGFYVFAPNAPGSVAFVDAQVDALRRGLGID